MKEIQHGTEARSRAVDALNEISKVVASTVGPAGRPILLSRETSAVSSTVFHTKDGITVLRELAYTDPVKDAVHKIAIQATADTVMNSGDGPQPLYSKVLTPAGFVEMKDVQVGMEICGTNGTIQKVLGVFPKGEREIFEVSFSNDRIVECCEDHLWTVTRATNKCPLQTKATKELFRDYVTYKKNGNVQHRYFTPRTIVEFMENEELPLDPYLVGVLLGDGSLSGSGSIEIWLGAKKEHVISKLRLPEGLSLTSTFVSSKNAFRVKIKGTDTEGRTAHDLVNRMGLLGTLSGTKFIPRSYLYSSQESRVKLLEGMIDTDGHINKRGAIEFSSVSKELAYDFVELCRGLGKTASIRLHDRKSSDKSYSMKSIYRVSVTKGPKYGDKIEKIVATGRMTLMQCIKVSNPDNLYITDGYITTHNTTSTLIMAAAFANALLAENDNDTDNTNVQERIRKYRAEVSKAIEYIEKEAVKSREAERSVALTSSNRDEELTEQVLKAIGETSAYGTVVVEKNPMVKEKYRVDKDYGYQAGSGYSYNVTLGISVSDIAVNNGEFTMDNSFIIPYNGNLTQVAQISPILDKLFVANQDAGGFNALIVCYEVSDDIVNQIIVANRKNPGVKIFISKTTPTAEVNGPWNQLNDIAAFSGAGIVDAGLASRWEIGDAGIVKTVRVGPYKTFISGLPGHNWVVKRAEQNKEAVALAPTQLDKDIISSRNASLTGGLVKLVIGSGLPGDIHEIADRADDAIRASQACRRSGALPGCGLSFVRAGFLANVSAPILNALGSVYSQITSNYGLKVALSDRVPEERECVAIIGDERKTGDFLELGVADSFETVKSVIMNGFNLGSMIANLGGYCLVADLDDIRKTQLLKNVMEI